MLLLWCMVMASLNTDDDYKCLEFSGKFRDIPAADIVLLEGILVLYTDEIRDLLDMKLFLDVQSDTRLSNRGRGRVSVISLHPVVFLPARVWTSS